MRRRYRVSRYYQPVIRGVNYGPGIAGSPGGPPRGRVLRVAPGMRWQNRGVSRPMHPMNYLHRHPYRTHTPGYY